MKRNAPLKKIDPTHALVIVACNILREMDIQTHEEACEAVADAIDRAAGELGADINRDMDDVLGDVYEQVHNAMGYDFPADDGSGDYFIVRGTTGELFCDKESGKVLTASRKYRDIYAIDLEQFRMKFPNATECKPEQVALILNHGLRIEATA